MALIYLVSVNEEIVKGWPCWNATCNLLSKAGSLSSEDQTIVDMASEGEGFMSCRGNQENFHKEEISFQLS